MNEQTDEHTKIGSRKINSKNLVKMYKVFLNAKISLLKIKKLKNKIFI